MTTQRGLGAGDMNPAPHMFNLPIQAQVEKKKERKRCTWIGLHILSREQHGATHFYCWLVTFNKSDRGNEGVSWRSLTASAGKWGWRGSAGQTNISLDHYCMEPGVNNAWHWIPNTGRMCDGKRCIGIRHVVLDRYLITSFPKSKTHQSFSQ